jgi:hypothetical protein
LSDPSVLPVAKFGASSKRVKIHKGLDDRDDSHPNSKGGTSSIQSRRGTGGIL